MKYQYVCNKCKTKKELEYAMGSAPKEVNCDCGGVMKQDFLGKLKSIQSDLPESYKALSEYAPQNYGSDDDMEKMMSI